MTRTTTVTVIIEVDSLVEVVINVHTGDTATSGGG